MTVDELTLHDMVGFPLWIQNVLYMKITGHWVGAVPGPTPLRVNILRAVGGFPVFLVLLYVAGANINGMVHNSDMTDISMNLIVLSTTVSALHKYSVFTNQQQALGRLGRWVKSVAAERKANNVPDTYADRVLKKALKAFYISGNVASPILIVKMMLTGNTFNVNPGVENFPKPFLMFLIAVSFQAIAWEAVVDGCILMNSLFVFRSELVRFALEWEKLNFDPHNPEISRRQLKAMVKKHVMLLGVKKDLKEYNNSMFGYQVFAAVFTTCALIYGCAKDTKFLGQAVIQVLPTSTASLLTFSILCWSGEEVTYLFQQIHRNIYMTNWFEAPREDKKSIIVILEFAKNPIIFTGFTVFTCTLTTFVETMKQSFSLYTILKAVL
uniref:Odorant receptor n=1 Tax=Adelphocoris lineolatus TaxID=236346 RepID=A0A2I4PH04_ADELI|nr:olfactory receptor 2 [Adelphocoris lineolatus]